MLDQNIKLLGEDELRRELIKLEPKNQKAAGSLIGRKFCHDNLILPIDVTADHITVGFPFEDHDQLQLLRDRAFKDLHVKIMDVSEIRKGLLSIWPKDDDDAADAAKSTRNRFIDDTILRAAELGASELVYQYEDDGGHVRYCVRGIWTDDQVINHDEMKAIIENTGSEAFGVYDKQLEQRGRLLRTLDGRDINLRVSSYPAWFPREGMPISKIVMRVLGRHELLPSFAHIGMTDKQATIFLGAIRSKKAGIIVAAPTGEGKSTTVYAGILALDPSKGNVYAIEDPPEIRIPFVTQTAINDQAGWTHERAMTATLRQKPSFVFVGESLDTDTARYAMRAMLQGYPSATSIHADDAVAALLRLMSLDIPIYQIQQGVTLLVSQRLLNPVCTVCASESEPSKEIIERCQSFHLPIPASVLHRNPDGCPRCFHTGLKMRQRAIFEMIPMTAELSNTIEQTRNPQQIAKIAYKHHPPLLAFARKLLADQVIDAQAFLEIPTPLTTDFKPIVEDIKVAS